MYPAPATLKPAPRRWTSYQQETALKAMCGSLANRGAPETDRLPESTQLLLPRASSGSPTAAPTRSTPEGEAG